MVKSMKSKAKKKGISVNRYVEELIERDLSAGGIEELRKILGKTKAVTKISDDILNLSVNLQFTKEELESDERLAYILSK